MARLLQKLKSSTAAVALAIASGICHAASDIPPSAYQTYHAGHANQTKGEFDGPRLSDAINLARQETGARIFILGENHAAMEANIKHIDESLADLGANYNVTTLYLEYPSNVQPLIDQALAGNPKAQRELRLRFEHEWGKPGGADAAQSRYDLLFAARDAGMRIKAVDMVESSDYMYRKQTEEGDYSDRLTLGDAVMARNIRHMDDGQGAIMMVGGLHTYAADLKQHKEKFFHHLLARNEPGSLFGGIEARLTQAGIPAASIDYIQRLVPAAELAGKNKIPIQLSGAPDEAPGQSNYVLQINENKDRPERTPPRLSTSYQIDMGRLADVYRNSEVTASVTGDSLKAAQFARLTRDSEQAARILDEPEFLASSPADQMKKFQAAVKKTNGVESRTQSENIKDLQLLNVTYDLMDTMLNYQDKASQVLKSNRELHAPEAARMWLRPPPSPVAGPKFKLN